ncbi:hypothetical protein RRG08_038558 [Elysia crispata]|uniref:Uncharacterized protein n=1 Tax=Elysia crispata TaxID=231223 RepID=A0AAE1EBI7_9GAST|nr:hypothetical protein RRG08_038558 [Elysia crispata]
MEDSDEFLRTDQHQLSQAWGLNRCHRLLMFCSGMSDSIYGVLLIDLEECSHLTHTVHYLKPLSPSKKVTPCLAIDQHDHRDDPSYTTSQTYRAGTEMLSGVERFSCTHVPLIMELSSDAFKDFIFNDLSPKTETLLDKSFNSLEY